MPKGAVSSLKTRRELDPLLETWNKRDQPDKVLEAEGKEGEEVAGNKLVPETVDIATENPESPLDLNPRPIHFQQENSGGSAESLDTSSDPSRDEIVEVTEFMQFTPHPRPLQRARARYEARTGNTPWEKRHIGADHHLSDLSQESQEQWEQERVYHRCDRCNNKLTDSDWSRFRSEGWDVETVRHLREVQRPLRLRCSPCIDSVARALARSARPREFH